MELPSAHTTRVAKQPCQTMSRAMVNVLEASVTSAPTKRTHYVEIGRQGALHLPDSETSKVVESIRDRRNVVEGEDTISIGRRSDGNDSDVEANTPSRVRRSRGQLGEQEAARVVEHDWRYLNGADDAECVSYNGNRRVSQRAAHAATRNESKCSR